MSDARPDAPILLLGAHGQVGRALSPLLGALRPLVATTREQADLADAAALRALVRDVRPVAVVNAAAYTAVDVAETDTAACEAVNGVAPGVLAEAAARAGALMVHFSTNYVFDGTLDRAYREDDPVAPLSVYGRTKAQGDAAVRAAAARHLIVRTGPVYDAIGHNFVRRMLQLARERDELRVVDDQRVAPTDAHAIAAASATMIARTLALPAGTGHGTYHLTAAGETTWHGFAERVLALDPGRAEQRARAVRPVSSEELGAAACRPRNGLLDTTRVARTFGITLPAWGVLLEDFMRRGVRAT